MRCSWAAVAVMGIGVRVFFAKARTASKSFSMVLIAPPGGNLPSSITLNHSCSRRESARPPCRAAGMRSASIPAFVASFAASASTARRLPTKVWLINLVAWPAPLGPIRVRRPARFSSITPRTAAKSSSDPPAMITSVPVSALGGPPETGASIMPVPWSARSRWAMRRDVSGSAVEKSTSIFPSARPSTNLPSPNSRSSSAAVLKTHVKMTSQSRASSAGLPASFAPAAKNGGSRSLFRAQTVRGRPCFSRRCAIAPPICPRPMKPSRGVPVIVASLSVCSKLEAFPPGRQAIACKRACDRVALFHGRIKKGRRLSVPPFRETQYCTRDAYIMPPIPPMPPISGIAGPDLSFGLSATMASVVISRPAMEAASCKAWRTTFTGSMMPALTRSQ